MACLQCSGSMCPTACSSSCRYPTGSRGGLRGGERRPAMSEQLSHSESMNCNSSGPRLRNVHLLGWAYGTQHRTSGAFTVGGVPPWSCSHLVLGKRKELDSFVGFTPFEIAPSNSPQGRTHILPLLRAKSGGSHQNIHETVVSKCWQFKNSNKQFCRL